MLKNIESLFLNYIFSHFSLLLLEINLHLYEVTGESPTCSFSSQSFFSLHFGLIIFIHLPYIFLIFKMIFLQAVNFYLVIFLKTSDKYIFQFLNFHLVPFSVFHSLPEIPIP